ncbi:MAG: hypothetical protein ACI9ZV_000034 [Candidatus Azotimanducaceae bacterium]|jgi:hypothetical protein
MTPKIHFWQWPNLLALDAALIAVLWQAALASALGAPLAMPGYIVLGLSVWLTYVADRLFDVASRPEASLLSLRHQFAKRYAQSLWVIWGGVLAINLLVAAQLSATQLKRGALLLALCLFYTLLNQKLSRRFFPKELCVALIYAGGVAVFLPTVPLGFVACFAWLCLLNCLIIGSKEQSIDAKLQVHSLAPLVAERGLGILTLVSALIILWIDGACSRPLALSCALLGGLHFLRGKLVIENFRVLADGLLLAAPLLYLLASRL